jgi:hypothetical protein
MAFTITTPRLIGHWNPETGETINSEERGVLKGVLRGPNTVRDSTNTIGMSVGFATNIVASPLAVAPAVAAAACAIARRLIGIRQ